MNTTQKDPKHVLWTYVDRNGVAKNWTQEQQDALSAAIRKDAEILEKQNLRDYSTMNQFIEWMDNHPLAIALLTLLGLFISYYL